MDTFRKNNLLQLLIISEDNDFAKDKASFLSELNYSVKIVSVIKGLESLLAEFTPQIALIINHHKEREIFELLSTKTPKIHCVMMSDNIDTQSSLFYLRQGAADFIYTSNHQSELLSALERISKQIKLAQTQKPSIQNIHYDILFQNVADGIFIHDQYGKIFDVNNAALDQLGHTHKEIQSLSIFDIEIGIPKQQLLDLWRSCELDKSRSVDGRHLRKDGSSFPVEIKISCYHQNNQKYLLAIARDITARQTAEKQEKEFINHLKYKAEQLAFQKRAIDEHAIVSITDVKGNIIYVNKKFEDISQFSQEEVIGKNHRLLKSDFHPSSFFKQMWQTISQGNAWHGEIKNRAKDGSEYWVKSTIVPLMNEQGKPEQYLAIRTEITYIKELELKQSKANLALLKAKQIAEQEKFNAERASKAKSNFLSSMSHELRTPLNAILGFSQLLESDPDEPLSKDQKESVDYIIAGGKHLLSLINEILELSSIEAGIVDLTIKTILLTDVIEESLLLISNIAQRSNITLSVVSNFSTPVQADSTKLKQILLNLISNAIKYNQKGGSVTIDWSIVNGNNVKISITDTGVGISEAHKKDVFGAFNRLGQESSAIEGTGVGLVVTKSLVELMGGTIGFKSEKNKGSTFWFTLPLGEQKNLLQLNTVDTPTEEPKIKTAPNKEKIQVLYVEDIAANRRLMQAFFNPKKLYSLQFAETGELGWEMLNKQHFDLILMDIHLPGIDGKTLTRQIKADDALKHIPVIAVTAAAMPSDMKDTKDLFDDYITKPFEFSVLKQILNKYN